MTDEPTPAEIRSTWGIGYTTPPTEKKRWKQNHHCNVVSVTAERAIACVRERHPDCTIISVNKTGRDSETLVDADVTDRPPTQPDDLGSGTIGPELGNAEKVSYPCVDCQNFGGATAGTLTVGMVPRGSGKRLVGGAGNWSASITWVKCTTCDGSGMVADRRSNRGDRRA